MAKSFGLVNGIGVITVTFQLLQEGWRYGCPGQVYKTLQLGILDQGNDTRDDAAFDTGSSGSCHKIKISFIVKEKLGY